MRRSVLTSCLSAALLLGASLSGMPAMAQGRGHMGGAVTSNSGAQAGRQSSVSRESMSRQAPQSSQRSSAPARSYSQPSRPQVSRPATQSQPVRSYSSGSNAGRSYSQPSRPTYSQPTRTYSRPATASQPVRSYGSSSSSRSYTTEPVGSYSGRSATTSPRTYSRPQVTTTRPATSGRATNGGSQSTASPYTRGGGSGTQVNPYARQSTRQPVRSYGSSSSSRGYTTEPVSSATGRSAVSPRTRGGNSGGTGGRGSWNPGASQPTINPGDAHSTGKPLADRPSGNGSNGGRDGGSDNYNKGDNGRGQGGGSNYGNGRGGNRGGHGGPGTYDGNKGFNPNFKGDRGSFDRGTYRGRPGGDRDRWNDRRDYYGRYGYRHGWEPRRGYNDRFFDHYRRGWLEPVRPPYRPWRPQLWVYTRPAIPYGWRPYSYAPIVDGILGLYFGTLYNETLNFLYYNNYTIDGYYDGTVYVRDVDLFGYSWPDVELRYDDYNALNYAQFSYSMGYCDWGRYNAIYRMMCDNYGRPVAVVSGAYPRVTWIGGDSRGFITLSMNGIGGRWYTSLSFGY